MQAQQAHASEVSFGVAALESDLTPLLRDAAGQGGVGTQLLPELQHKDTKKPH